MTSASDALMAARMLAVDPGLGAVVRGSAREAWVEAVRGAGVRMRRVPLGVTEDRLGGGLDLAATLAAGRPVMMRGLLAEGGVLVLPMAERIAPGLAARLAAEGGAAGLVALDEGVGEEERVPGVLLERLALHVTVDEAVGVVAVAGAVDVAVPEGVVEALCAAGAALGVGSMRAAWLAVRAARAAAAVAGRVEVDAEDAALAARLVLGPRATVVPGGEEAEKEVGDEKPGEGVPSEASGEEEGGGAMEDVVLAAAKAAMPAGLLTQVAGVAAGAARRAGVAGALHRGGLRGRPAGVRAGHPRATGLRLNLMETLRAAAPWQGVRGRGDGPVRLREADFRVTRLKQRAETVTVFVVDASGSSALNRLAEAKGAVELLLAQSYVRRDRVAVVAFRGRGAEVLLPPTRSLVRAKRSLAGLPGGGGTPLAAGILAGMAMAEGERRRGATATMVLLTDGRGNVALDGRGNRGVAEAEALDAARRVRAGGVRAVLVDTSPRAHAPNRALAALMGARYVALPAVDAASLSRAVRA